MIPGEEKQLVLHDRAARCSTKLIAFVRAVLRREIIPGVEQIVAHKLKQIPVKLVGSGLRHRRYCRRISVLGVYAAGLDLELLHRIWKGHVHCRSSHVIHVIGTVQTVPRAPTGAASNGEDRRRPGSPPDSHNIDRLRAGALIDGSAGEYDQIGHVASVERQFQYPFVFDHRTDSRIPRVYESRVRLNFDLFTHLAHFQNHIDNRTGIDLQHDAGPHIGPESWQCGLQSIRTRRQVRHNVGSSFIADGRPRDSGVRLSDGDFHTGQHGAALIFYGAADLCRRLRPHGDAGKKRNQRNRRHENDNTSHTSSLRELPTSVLWNPSVATTYW